MHFDRSVVLSVLLFVTVHKKNRINLVQDVWRDLLSTLSKVPGLALLTANYKLSLMDSITALFLWNKI